MWVSDSRLSVRRRGNLRHAILLAAVCAAVIGCKGKRRFDRESALNQFASPLAALSFDFEVQDAVLDRDGTLLIADRAGRVLRVDGVGSVLEVIGRPGDGPCEFRGISWIAALPRRRVAVSDGHPGQIRLCAAPGHGISPETVLIPSRTVAPLVSSGTDTVWIAATTSADSVLGLRLTLSSDRRTQVDTMVILSGGLPPRHIEHFSSGSVMYLAPIDTTYRIYAQGREDDRRKLFAERSVPSLKLTEYEWSELSRSVAKQLARTGRPVPAGPRAMPPGSTKPWLIGGRRLGEDLHGRLWVLPSSSDSTPSHVLDVFGRSGELLTRYQVPGGATGFSLHDSILVVFHRQEDGVSTVRTFALPVPNE